MLRIEMLPAGNGDALWIEYGGGDGVRRVLVDGGTRSTWDEGLRTRIERLPPGERHFELLAVTHIDGDHIDGALELLRDDSLGATYGDVWFNGWRHLPDTPLESLGPIAGEALTDVLVSKSLPWNAAFGGRAVAVRPNEPLPRIELAGGPVLTVLSPLPEQLARLKPAWEEAIREAGLDPERPREPTPPEEPLPAGIERLGAETLPDVAAMAATPFEPDAAEANGSSIVLLLEYEGASVILSADGFPSVILSSLERLLAERRGDRVALDAFKLPHHGSRMNVSRELVAGVDCRRFLFSTSGAHTHHPHLESVARTLAAAGPGSSLYFNYRTRHNEVWAREELREQHAYDAVYPAEGETGLALELG